MAEKKKYNSILVSGRKDETLTYSKYVKDEESGESVKESLDKKVNRTDELTTQQIKDGAITNEKMAAGSVGNTNLQDGSVSNEKLEDGSITNEKLAENSITKDKLKDNTIGVEKLDPELRQTINAATGLPENLVETIQNVDDTLKDHQSQLDDKQSQIDDKQQQITANDEDISLLQTRSTQMEETIKSIAATGGASQATAVTYNNDSSGLNALNVQHAIDEVSNMVIYDVSARNGGVVFESLQALLSSSNLNTLIPTSARMGGMAIRFIQGSDNKYVQFRYMGTDVNGTPNPFLDTANWQAYEDIRDVFNINAYANKSDSYGGTEAAYNIARGAVPVKYRKVGLVITFLTDYGWIEEQFVGSSNLDLSIDTNWWKASNWRINCDVVNVNKLINNYSRVFESLREAAIAVVDTGLVEYRKKGETLLFKYGEKRRHQIIINSETASSDGTMTLTLGSSIYTVSYISGETAGSILGKIAALSAEGFSFSYTSGNSYLYIDSLTFGFVNILVRNNGGISLTNRLIKKGMDETWREFSFDYSGNAVSDYWSHESYWKELTKCNYIEDYLYQENYTEVGDILYDVHNVPYRWQVIWEDYTTGIFELKDWDASNNMYKGYEVTYGNYKLIQPSVTVLNYNITKVPYKYVQKFK